MNLLLLKSRLQEYYNNWVKIDLNQYQQVFESKIRKIAKEKC